MTRRAIVAAVVSLSTLAGIEAHAAFPQSPEMMAHYLQHQAEQRFEHWRQRYEQLKTPEQIAAYQKDLREHFLQAIGGLPERTPLNPRITGVVQREGYRVEKIIFESQPQHYVTALLFLPDAARFSSGRI